MHHLNRESRGRKWSSRERVERGREGRRKHLLYYLQHYKRRSLFYRASVSTLQNSITISTCTLVATSMILRSLVCTTSIERESRERKGGRTKTLDLLLTTLQEALSFIAHPCPHYKTPSLYPRALWLPQA